MTNVDRHPRDPRSTHLVLLAILVVAAGVRLRGIHFSLWLDETATLAFARQPLGHLWGEWMVRETNPPLFYTLLKAWQSAFGMADPVARLLPISIGLAGVWGMFLLGRAIGGARAGLLAAGLLALSAMHVEFSLQLRGYGMAHTGVVFSCLGMVRFLQDRRLRWLLLYGLASWVALYSHTTLALFVGLANGGMILLLRRDRAALLRWLGTNLLLALGWSWWAWMTVRQLGQPHNFAWIATPGLGDAWQMITVTFGSLYLRGATIGGGLLVMVMLGGAALFVRRRVRPETALLAILLFGAPLLLFTISQKTPIFLPRTLLWTTVPLLALLASAVADIADRRIAFVVGAALLSLNTVGVAAWYTGGEQEQWPLAAATLERQASGRDIWVGDDAVALALAHYFPDAEARVIVIDRPGGPHERWANGLFTGRHLSVGEAVAMFHNRCRVASVSRGGYDPSPLLTAAGGIAIPIGNRSKNPLVALWDCEAAGIAR